MADTYSDYGDYSQDHKPDPSGELHHGHEKIPDEPPHRDGTSWRFNALNSCLVAGCVTVFVPFLLLAGFFFLVYSLASVGLGEATSGPLASLVQSTGQPNIRTRELRAGKTGAGAIAVVHIHGAIDGRGSTLDGDGNLAFVSQQLRLAADDDSVKAVILQIDSPGGGLTASDLIHHEVQLLRRKGKPVLAWAGGMMLSGGYYVAVAADKIMANPTATIGSIGVILQHFQVGELLEKMGVRVDPVTSGEHKDMGSPFREMTPEERRLLQEYVDGSHRRFVEIVAKGRGLPEDRVLALADGGIHNADAALELGLVDLVGYMNDAVDWAEKAANEEGMRIVGYRRIVSLTDLFAEAGQGAASAFLQQLEHRGSSLLR